VKTPLRPLLLAILVLATALIVISKPPREAQAALEWKGCGGSFECARLSVPLNYEAASGRQIELALIRQKAKDPSQRIGSLLVNPGGPGGGGIDFTRYWARAVPAELQQRFDIVGFDPRGVGESTPLVCHDDLQKLMALDPTPDDDAEWQQVFDTSKAFVAACVAKGGDLLPYLGTQNVARDLDRIREALGDSKLTFFGYSYGTVIGSVYADMFPQNVRAVVLDGAVDYSLPNDVMSLQQALGFEGALKRYTDNCARTNCPLTKRGEPMKVVEDLIAKAEKAPIPAPGADRPAGPGETLLGILGSLYSQDLWGELTTAIEKGLDGDGTTLIKATDRYLGRDRNGDYDNSTEMNVAVNCLDYANSRDPQYYKNLARQYATKAPHFGESVGSGGLLCAYWPPDPTPLKAPRATGSAPILVIGTTGDPATPYAWAVALSKQLENATLLTKNGEGHTAFRSGNGCIDEAVDEYLFNLKLPAKGTACGDASMANPIQVSETPVPAAEGPLLAEPEGEAGFTTTGIAIAAGLILSCLVLAVAIVAFLSRRGPPGETAV
jgi:pimeloyl-ACP methyl ester carboxylesterase